MARETHHERSLTVHHLLNAGVPLINLLMCLQPGEPLELLRVVEREAKLLCQSQ